MNSPSDQLFNIYNNSNGNSINQQAISPNDQDAQDKKPAAEINTDSQFLRYDRQIRIWGIDAQKRF